MGGILDAAHLVAHHGAGAGASGKDEVGHPDMAVERVAVEGLTGWLGELELGHLAEDGQGLYGNTGGEEEEQEKQGERGQGRGTDRGTRFRKPGTDGAASGFPAKGAGNPWQSRQSPEGTVR